MLLWVSKVVSELGERERLTACSVGILSGSSYSVYAREVEAGPRDPGEHPLSAPGWQGLGPVPPGGPEEGGGRPCRHPHTDPQRFEGSHVGLGRAGRQGCPLSWWLITLDSGCLYLASGEKGVCFIAGRRGKGTRGMSVAGV